MTPEDTVHEYRIRLDDTGHEVVRATVDRPAQTITLELPNGLRDTIDVVTARAVCMLLHEAVYSSLEPVGPFLRVERCAGDGWTPGGLGR
ncbi:MAG: hypothetical protein ACRDJ9_33870 [Dehalococcoidia bacterium]